MAGMLGTSTRSGAAMRVLRLQGWHILHQLWLEEALMYHTNQNWLVLNRGPRDPTIVMGVSGKPDELLNMHNVERDKISVLRRFTGGGTVVVDSSTTFVSFVLNNDDAGDGTRPYPREIMKWSEGLYKPVFDNLLGGISTFQHLENDYVIFDRKIAGNAQAISKNRWIHHTSFLVDFSDAHMASYLAMPKKRPEYRRDRGHGEFMVRLNQYEIGHENLIDGIVNEVQRRHSVDEVSLADIEQVLEPLGGFAAWSATCRTKVLRLGGELVNEALPLSTESDVLIA